MNNAELFKKIFGIYAEEFWALPEEKMLDWIASDAPDIYVGKWAPVKEEMPEVGEEVFISTDTKMVFTAFFNSVYWEDDDGYTWGEDNVLAWMHEPESFKGESDDE